MGQSVKGNRLSATLAGLLKSLPRSAPASKRRQHNPTPEVSYPVPADPPVIAAAALLALANWLRQRSASTQGDGPCNGTTTPQSPPASDDTAGHATQRPRLAEPHAAAAG